MTYLKMMDALKILIEEATPEVYIEMLNLFFETWLCSEGANDPSLREDMLYEYIHLKTFLATLSPPNH